jgi:hypothetical protein
MNLRASIAALPEKGAYVAAWKRLNAMPVDGQVSVDWMGPRPVAQVRRDFRLALDRRINLRGGMPEANVPIDIGLVRDAYRLDDILKRRVRVYQFESELARKRFGHLLASHDD